MNERIQALAEQAEKYASEKDGKYDGAGNLNWQWQDIKMEKFAELLIQQCMACSIWVGKNNTNSVEPVHTAHAVNQRIKQQFGVEE